MLKVSAKKILMVLLLGFVITGCSSINPPNAPSAQGKWEEVYTTPSDLKSL